MAVHRFVHIGDLHLGPNARNVDRRAALEQIVEEQLRQPVAAWLLPGDLNHGLMSIPDRNFLTNITQRMAEHAPVIDLYGNHDLPGELDFLAKLGARWPIYVIDRPEVIRVKLATGERAAIFCFPYPSRAGLVAAGTPSELVAERAREALEAIFLHAANELSFAAEQGDITLMIGHVNVGGSIASSGQPSIGREIELDPVLLNRLGPIYKGLNHIHRAQEIGGAIYAGSCCRLDWGEIEPKRYLVINYGTGDEIREGATEADGWIFSVEPCPLDVAPMYHVEGELTRERFDWTLLYDGEAFSQEETGRMDFSGAEVRVRFRYVAADKPVLDFEKVKAPFAGAKRIDLDPIAEHTRAIRQPDVAAAETLEQKIQAFVRGAGVPWTPAMAEKFFLLQLPDGGADFLSALEHTLMQREAVLQ